jgi:cob(I)alamin adenosyltransferase
MPIYTKKGDAGTTCILGSKERVKKASVRLRAIGAIDELNSYLGVSASYSENPETCKFISSLQRDLFLLNSILAGNRARFSAARTKKLERRIDEADKTLPKLANFILVSGTKLAVHLQYCRSLARRAERQVVALSQKEKVNAEVLRFLNRLSDLLFTLAREANHQAKVKDELWR